MTGLEEKLLQKLEQLLPQCPYELTSLQKEKLVKLVGLLNKWNKAYNLTAIRDPEEMLIKHILDSLAVGPYLQGERFIDVGTGPGLPGLPLAIMYPEKEFFLLDSLGKRIQFIRNAVRELELKNVTPILSRVEEYHPEEKFDGVLSRAFASLNDMTTWCAHLPNLKGRYYALKGQCHEDEFQEISDKFLIEEKICLEIPQLMGDRHLILVKNR